MLNPVHLLGLFKVFQPSTQTVNPDGSATISCEHNGINGSVEDIRLNDVTAYVSCFHSFSDVCVMVGCWVWRRLFVLFHFVNTFVFISKASFLFYMVSEFFVSLTGETYYKSSTDYAVHDWRKNVLLCSKKIFSYRHLNVMFELHCAEWRMCRQF